MLPACRVAFTPGCFDTCAKSLALGSVPPLGLNVFVLKGITPDVPIWTIYKGVMPFCVADLIKLVLMVLIPAIMLWLPSTMIR